MKKREKRELPMKSNDTRKKNLNTTHIKSSYHFIIQKFFYSSFLFFPHDTLKGRVFRNNAIPLRIYLLQKIISHLR